MAKKNDSNLKKAGRFVANELLGVDDAKRAVNKARKGDIKGALKSAAAGALELGTTATAVGKGGMIAAKIGAKTVSKKTVEKTSTDIGQAAGRRVAEKLKPANISREGKTFTKKVEGKATTTSKSGSKSVTPDAKTVSGTTRKPTAKEVAGRMAADAKKRTKAIVSTASSAKAGSAPIVKKALADTSVKRLAQGSIATKAAKEISKPNKKGK
jgi:hypothetical protein